MHYLEHRIKQNQTRVAPLLFIFLSIISVIYLAHFGIIYFNDDFIYHFDRINGMIWNLKSGHFPLLYQGSTVPYGTIVSYYPWLTLIPFVLLHFLIHNEVYLFYAIIGIITLATYLSSYYSYHTYDKNWLHAFVYTIFYTNSSMLFDWAFQEGDFGTILAMGFAPIALFGFLDLMNNNRHSIMLCCGLILILSSHVITGGAITICLVLLGLLNISKFKPTAILKAIIVGIITIGFSSIYWYPALVTKKFNNIVMPVVPSRIRAGFLTYWGSTCNYIYALIDVIGVFAILMIMSKKFHWIDLEMWSIGVLSILVNIKWIAYTITDTFPALRQLQFAYRFGTTAHLFLSFLALKLLLGFYNDKKHHVNRIICILVTTFLLFVPLFNQIDYHFLMKSRPLLRMSTMYTNRSKQYRFDEKSCDVLNHHYYNGDYASSPKVVANSSFDDKYKLSIYNSHGKWIGAKHYKANPHYIIFYNKNYKVIQFPIMLYRGVDYTFALNKQKMNPKYINKKITEQTHELVLQNLPKNKTNTISIRTAHIEHVPLRNLL